MITHTEQTGKTRLPNCFESRLIIEAAGWASRWMARSVETTTLGLGRRSHEGKVGHLRLELVSICRPVARLIGPFGPLPNALTQ